ncbi:MAG TPA: hypothetical protein DCQ77_01090, partial [Betaproteobacteria bacterium]|nr:hypothetical protein [Betaproteobacteria bacterium]
MTPAHATHWHQQSAEQTCADFDVEPARGLPTETAAHRLVRHGANRLMEKPPRSVWLKFLDQFRDLLVIVLIGAAVLAGAIGDIKD